MSKRKITIGVVAILLVGGSVWAWMRRPDPQVEKVKQLQAEAFKEGATPEQRHQAFEQVHQEMEKLTPDQRHEVREQGHQEFERRMDQRITAYFALPKAERVAYLDKQIDEMEKHRKEWEARRAQSQAGGRQQGNAGQQGGAGRQGGAGQQGNAGQQGGPPRSNNPEARMQRRNERLDRSTAQQRAMRSAYMADMQQRRLQRGLPMGPPGRPR